MAVGKVAGTGPAQVATMSSCCLGQVPTCPCHSLLPSLLQEFGVCGWMVDAGCSCPAGRRDNHFPFAVQNQTIGTVLEKTGSEWGFPERIEKNCQESSEMEKLCLYPGLGLPVLGCAEGHPVFLLPLCSERGTHRASRWELFPPFPQ